MSFVFEKHGQELKKLSADIQKVRPCVYALFNEENLPKTLDELSGVLGDNIEDEHRDLLDLFQENQVIGTLLMAISCIEWDNNNKSQMLVKYIVETIIEHHKEKPEEEDSSSYAIVTARCCDVPQPEPYNSREQSYEFPRRKQRTREKSLCSHLHRCNKDDCHFLHPPSPGTSFSFGEYNGYVDDDGKVFVNDKLLCTNCLWTRCPATNDSFCHLRMVKGALYELTTCWSELVQKKAPEHTAVDQSGI